MLRASYRLPAAGASLAALFQWMMFSSFQGILAKFKQQLTLIVDDQLTSRKENRATLVLVGIVQVEFAAVRV